MGQQLELSPLASIQTYEAYQYTYALFGTRLQYPLFSKKKNSRMICKGGAHAYLEGLCILSHYK